MELLCHSVKASFKPAQDQCTLQVAPILESRAVAVKRVLIESECRVRRPSPACGRESDGKTASGWVVPGAIPGDFLLLGARSFLSWPPGLGPGISSLSFSPTAKLSPEVVYERLKDKWDDLREVSSFVLYAQVQCPLV